MIRYATEHAFVGDANYMGDCGPLSRQKNDLITRKTDLSPQPGRLPYAWSSQPASN
jgi:hypothetical protein